MTALPSAAFALFVMALSLARIVLGIWLFTAPLTLRDGGHARIPASLAGLLAVYIILSSTLLIPLSSWSGLGFSLGQLAVFSLLLLASVGTVLAIYDTSIWTALFCCSAGYTIQNLASGATELVWSLFGGGVPGTADFLTPARFAVSAITMFVVYGVTYLLITRRLRSEGLERIEDRSMIAMMAVVILVIIGFDIVIKWLTEQGIVIGAMVFLRIFHGLACVFTIAMEFQLLITRRAEAARDTLQAVISEQERQYEQSRETVAAVNARLHDIRHSIARISADGGVESNVIRDIVREISIYDTKIRTGNEALDVVLSEKRLMLEREGIGLTCVADGAALSFMAPADIYTLFAALLDRLAASGATSISLVVRDTLGSTSIHIECNGANSSSAWPDSARGIVHRYGGTFSVSEQDGILQVNALFPA